MSYGNVFSLEENLKYDFNAQKEINLRNLSKDELVKIINILKEEPKITLYDVSIKINKSLKTVKNIVKKLEEEEIVIREGSKKTGSWKVLK